MSCVLIDAPTRSVGSETRNSPHLPAAFPLRPLLTAHNPELHSLHAARGSHTAEPQVRAFCVRLHGKIIIAVQDMLLTKRRSNARQI